MRQLGQELLAKGPWRRVPCERLLAGPPSAGPPSVLDHPCGLQFCDMFIGLRVKLNSHGSGRQRAVTVVSPWIGGVGGRRTINPKILLWVVLGWGRQVSAGGLGVRPPSSPIHGRREGPHTSPRMQIANPKPQNPKL